MEIQNNVHFNPSTRSLEPAKGGKHPSMREITAKIEPDPTSPAMYAHGVTRTLTATGIQAQSNTAGVGKFIKGDASQFGAFVKSIKNAQY